MYKKDPAAVRRDLWRSCLDQAAGQRLECLAGSIDLDQLAGFPVNDYQPLPPGSISSSTIK
jgi:hypothetical protein